MRFSSSRKLPNQFLLYMFLKEAKQERNFFLLSNFIA